MIFLLRCLIVPLYFLVVAFLGTLGCLLRPFNPDNSRLVGKAFSVGGLFLLGIKLRVENPEGRLDLPPGVVVSNHQSNLDLFVHGAVIPKSTVSIGKSSLKYLPFFGQMYWLSGNIMIDRSNAKASIKSMDQVSEAINKKGTSIWVFAEGTRSGGRGLAPFKKGAFHMALQAQCSIYPIVSSTYSGRLKLNQWVSGEVIIQIMEPIQTKDLGSEDLNDLVLSTHQKMAKEIARLDAEVKANAGVVD
jgi:1-acyl-sn-glycerol-3-phosphate acyltransferase